MIGQYWGASILLLTVVAAGHRASSLAGAWTMNTGRSTSSGGAPVRAFKVRIQPHSKGEVFTVERTDGDGRITTSSSVLYFDAVARDLHDFDCAGTQQSRRVDAHTVEIIRSCGPTAWTRIVRRAGEKPTEFVLMITEQRDGRRVERRIVLNHVNTREERE